MNLARNTGPVRGWRIWFFALALSGFCLFAQVSQEDERLSRVRVTTPDSRVLADELEARGFDVLEGGVLQGSLDVVVNAREWRELTALGLDPVLVERGRPLNEILSERSARGVIPTGYLDLAQLNAAMNAIAGNFPGIAEVVDITDRYGAPSTEEDRHIFAMKISDNVADDEDEPSLLVVSCHHSREIVTPVIAMNAIEQFTSLYGADPQITDLVNKYEIWIAPVWNPDGYNWVFTGDNLWRKNRHVFVDGTGVDLNRNYPMGWDSGCSGSTVVSSQTYKGPSAGSEAETQTLMAFSMDRHFTKVIDYHSSGQEVLWSYVCTPHPFSTFFQQVAIALSSASGYGGSNRTASSEGEHYQWQINQNTSLSFLIETHTTFQPTFARAEAEAQVVWPGILWMLEAPINLTGLITDSATGDPVSASVTLTGVNFPAGDLIENETRFGRYHVFMPTGQYDVSFSADGYLTQNHVVDIDESTEMTLDIALAPETVCRGDLNGDLSITMIDLARVVNALGQMGVPEDINNDGVVDGLDILALLPGWGACLPLP